MSSGRRGSSGRHTRLSTGTTGRGAVDKTNIRRIPRRRSRGIAATHLEPAPAGRHLRSRKVLTSAGELRRPNATPRRSAAPASPRKSHGARLDNATCTERPRRPPNTSPEPTTEKSTPPSWHRPGSSGGRTRRPGGLRRPRRREKSMISDVTTPRPPSAPANRQTRRLNRPSMKRVLRQHMRGAPAGPADRATPPPADSSPPRSLRRQCRELGARAPPEAGATGPKPPRRTHIRPPSKNQVLQELSDSYRSLEQIQVTLQWKSPVEQWGGPSAQPVVESSLGQVALRA